MSKLMLTVIKCTPSKMGGFILKLQNTEASKSEMTPFGQKTAKKQVTYYFKVDEANPVGKKAEMDISEYDIQERDYTIDDPQSEDNGKTVPCKWLHFKQS